ncbi:MAG: hypothetical protein Q8T03_13395 [Bacteroidota bacterium]|nr:hypothetical protein [Bacteroidota bacterium]MDP3558361.1 hypothetical protein [Bacteroidota bacterium]
MERRETVKVKSGTQFDHLFPRAMLTTITKKKGATVADTIRFIPQVVRETLFHTEKIARVLKRKTTEETCRAIWQFVYDHIAYKKDEDGKEQIRSPARAWHDRANIQGVDCDCYTVFISSILSNLKIRHILRITKYKEDHFQHIYPIVPLNGGSYITIDCVVNHFNYEEPYSEKKDTTMDLEYLNGVNDPNSKATELLELDGIYDDQAAMAELGKLFKRKSSGGAPKQKSGGFKQTFKKGAIKEAYKKGGIKAIAKIGLHVTNRLNPATVLIRNGILLAMKTNMFKIAQRLRYAYLTEDKAREMEVDMDKFQKLKKVNEKLQNIFYGAGGIPENYKKAILTGRGNKDHQVNGLGYVVDDMSGINKYSTTEELLGTDIYQGEELQVLNGLGEPYSAAASITAATGILGAIAGLLKGIGSLFPKKNKASKDFEEGGSESGGESGSNSNESGGGGESDSANDGGGSGESGNNNQITIKKNTTPSKNESSSNESSSNENSGGANEEGGGDSGGNSKTANKESSGGDPKPEGFWEKNKKWIKPVGIGAAALGLLYAGYRMVTGKKKENAKPALSGIPKSTKKKQSRKGGKKSPIKSKKQKKEAVALL